MIGTAICSRRARTLGVLASHSLNNPPSRFSVVISLAQKKSVPLVSGGWEGDERHTGGRRRELIWSEKL
jgi:hypothetical protein